MAIILLLMPSDVRHILVQKNSLLISSTSLKRAWRGKAHFVNTIQLILKHCQVHLNMPRNCSVVHTKTVHIWFTDMHTSFQSLVYNHDLWDCWICLMHQLLKSILPFLSSHSASIQSLHSILQREDPCINLAYDSCESLLRKVLGKFIKLNAILRLLLYLLLNIYTDGQK